MHVPILGNDEIFIIVKSETLHLIKKMAGFPTLRCLCYQRRVYQHLYVQKRHFQAEELDRGSSQIIHSSRKKTH